MMVYVVMDKDGVILSYHWSMEDALFHAPKGCCVFLDKVDNDLL